MKPEGFCAPEFERVRDAFLANFTEGNEVGASVAVTRDGVPVVDLWAGSAVKGGAPWQRDTIVNVYSTTKTMAATCVLVLADRGAVDFDAPVARYWPEFAQNGKEGVLVSHVMSHSAGLSGFDPRLDKVELLYDWDGDHPPAGAAEAVVEAGRRLRLPRRDARLPPGRDRAPSHRQEHRHVLPRRDRGAARRRLPHRPAGRRARPPRGARASAGRHRRHADGGGLDRRAHDEELRAPGHRAAHRGLALRRDPRGRRRRQRALGGARALRARVRRRASTECACSRKPACAARSWSRTRARTA